MKNKKSINNQTIVFKVSDNVKEEIIKYYSDILRDKKPPYSVFQADDGAGTVTTLYESGKLMIQGISADLDYEFWKAREKILNNRDLDEELKKEQEKKDKKKEELNDPRFKTVSTIGSDEVGTGDYFGPIIVTATYASKDNLPYLAGLGITDSKKITDKKIMELAPLIMKKVPYETYILTPEEYNKMSNFNMNKIKAIMHNKVLSKLKEKNYEYSYIVVDQFTYIRSYFGYLTGEPNVVRNITFTPRAESKCLSVAAASIISRYLFIKEMEKIETKIGSKIPKGAGLNVDAFVKEYLKTHSFESLKPYIKLNFKNTQKILGE